MLKCTNPLETVTALRPTLRSLGLDPDDKFWDTDVLGISFDKVYEPDFNGHYYEVTLHVCMDAFVQISRTIGIENAAVRCKTLESGYNHLTLKPEANLKFITCVPKEVELTL